MVLNLNKTVEKLKMDKKQEQKNPELIAAEQENKLLRERLDKLSSDQGELALQKEAEMLAKSEEALVEEADLRKTLGTEFTALKAGLKDDEEVSQEQLIAIMGEAVGASSEAQGKLILSKVASMMKQSDNEIVRTQELLAKLAAGMSMERARASNPDFDDYRVEVADIMSRTRGLDSEQAFLLAKAERLKGQPEQKRIETERPGIAPSSPSYESSRDDYTQEKDPDVQRSPKATFNSAVSAALDKVIAARKG